MSNENLKNHVLRMKVSEIITAVEKKTTESLEGLNYLVIRQSLKFEIICSSMTSNGL